MSRPSASVVVLAWNAWETTRACLASLLPTLGPIDELVVVDNGSTDGTGEGLAALLDGEPRARVTSNVVNIGFAAGCNQGAALSRAEVLVFLNSDTLVTAGWLEGLLEPFGDPRVAATGPMSNFVSGPQLLAGARYSPGDLGSQAGLAASLASVTPPTEPVERLVGFCLAVRTESFTSIGGFDPRFEGGGYEDDDLCARLVAAGGRLLVCRRVFVHHEGHASFDANGLDWVASELANRRRFVEKHSGQPTADRPLVSLCMIARDEAELLAACIESTRGFADEVVVYDTGSTDETREVAARLGATVVEGYWDDDFSRARNASLERCSGEWILWLDADEVLSGDLPTLRRRLAGGWDDVEGYVVRIENLHGNGLAARSGHVACRLFRSDKGRWVGRLHEQVWRRDEPAFLTMAQLADVHVVHRGYLEEIYRSRKKSERNLRLAEAEVSDDTGDRPYALMNLGRSRFAAGQPEAALEALEEAAATAGNPTVARTALRVQLDVLLSLDRAAEALGVAGRLRELSSDPTLADIAEGRCRLALGEVDAGLALLATVTEPGADEDGFDYGPHTLAALRGSALAGIGRHGEAADLVLDAARRFGVLDLDLGQLAVWLLAAGRDPAEIAAAAPDDALGPLCAQCLHIPLPIADALLDGLAARWPERVEPLAAAAGIAPHLPVTRALVWSARLRRAGQVGVCPLIAIAGNDRVEPRVRLRAAAAAHGSFGDPRAVPAARRLLGALDGDPEALGELERIAPLLAATVAGSTGEARLVAVNVGSGDDRRPGYVNVDLRPEVADVVADAAELPLTDGSAREVLARDVLEHVSTWQVPVLLAEWWRVLAPGGRLVLRVPNLEVLARWLVEDRSSPEVVRNIYGGHRFGPGGAWDAHHSGWTPGMLSEQLARAGFRVVANDGDANMTVVAERMASTVRHPGERTDRDRPPEATVVVPVYEQAALTRRCLEALAGTDAGADFELVVVDNGSTDATPALLDTLGGDVTVVRNETNLGFARACNQGARLARSPVVVLLNNDTEVRAGWLRALLDALDRHPDAGAVGARLVYPDGRLQHTGISLVPDPANEALDGTLRTDNPGPWALDVPAVSGACMAVRSELFAALGGFDEGYWNGNEDVDLCLRLREAGWAVLLEPAATVVHHESASGPERWRRVRDNRQRLSDRWAHRLGEPALADPPAATRAGRTVTVQPAPGGLNVVGYLDAALGLGQAARAMVGALEAAGVPVSTWSSHHHPSAEPDAFAPRGAPFAWDTTLVVANPEEHLAVVEEIGIGAFPDRYLIGMWFWELEEPSPFAAPTAGLLHEIWVPSAFAAESLRRAVHRPVVIVPLPVTAPAPGGATRSEVGMPPGFVFASAFDFNSVVERKNPAGLVEAFCRAFSPGEGPSLYLKSLNGSRLWPTELAGLRSLIGGRPDIVLVDEAFEHRRAAALPGLADCWVSLHRSEGFGLTLAEAMAAGTPVVATGYSGNLEFMSPANSRLVPYRMTEVPTGGIGPYRQGARWADPDLDAAARILREVWEHPEHAIRLAERARRDITAGSSPAAIGALVAARLETIAAGRRPRVGAGTPG